jgi:hypothetical protein
VKYGILLITLILCACSGKTTDTGGANFNITLGLAASGASNLQGGVTLVAESLDPSLPDYVADLDSEFKAEIPYGEYNILLVGWDGPGPWQGTTYCGSIVVLLETAEKTVDITLNQSNCTLPVYSGIITSKGGAVAALWDSATWDSSTWGP